MAQKIHPHALRGAAHTRSFDHTWYSEHFYGTLVVYDLRLMHYLQHLTMALGLPQARTHLHISPQASRLSLCLCLPEKIAGQRPQSGLTPYMAHVTHTSARMMHGAMELIPRWTPWIWQDAHYVLEELRRRLERRMSFRRIQRTFLTSLGTSPHLQGLRVVCAGRVGGKSKKAQRARRDVFQCGQTSLHSVAAAMDFAQGTARTPLGAMGIKVWLRYRSHSPLP